MVTLGRGTEGLRMQSGDSVLSCLNLILPCACISFSWLIYLLNEQDQGNDEIVIKQRALSPVVRCVSEESVSRPDARPCPIQGRRIRNAMDYTFSLLDSCPSSPRPNSFSPFQKIQTTLPEVLFPTYW